jgi:hypothetical protein
MFVLTSYLSYVVCVHINYSLAGNVWTGVIQIRRSKQPDTIWPWPSKRRVFITSWDPFRCHIIYVQTHQEDSWNSNFWYLILKALDLQICHDIDDYIDIGLGASKMCVGFIRSQLVFMCHPPEVIQRYFVGSGLGSTEHGPVTWTIFVASESEYKVAAVRQAEPKPSLSFSSVIASTMSDTTNLFAKLCAK